MTHLDVSLPVTDEAPGGLTCQLPVATLRGQ